MTLTLLALAAGMASRFGGPKQLEPLGPCGETMLDYAVHDARRAGFERVVLVVRAEMRDAFTAGIVARWRPRIEVALVQQEVDAARRKPWGTGHAVLAARSAIDGPFAVVNADDYYGGVRSYASLATYLRGLPPHASDYAVVGFPLADTLSGAGGVNRALLRSSPDGWLEHIEEVEGIERAGSDGVVRGADGVRRALAGTLPVSMNMWGFTRAVFPQLDRGFRAFRSGREGDAGAEFLLPTYVESLVRDRRARVRVLPGGGPWCGVTHPGDRERTSALLRTLAERGEYACPVWA
ncbi:MAG TPA: NTP transferase domain-containing protein [Gemmatimonadaceae bacterium]